MKVAKTYEFSASRFLNNSGVIGGTVNFQGNEKLKEYEKNQEKEEEKSVRPDPGIYIDFYA